VAPASVTPVTAYPAGKIDLYSCSEKISMIYRQFIFIGVGMLLTGCASFGSSKDTLPATPPTISAVVISRVTARGATLTWKTDQQSTSQVEYGTSTAYGSLSALDTSKLTSHSVALSGLAASTPYHFRVRSKDAAGNEARSSDLTFITTAAPTTPATTAETVSYYQAVYDAEYQKNQTSLDAMAASGDGNTYYTFQYAFGGTLSMYEATSDPKYLERALTWAETMVSKATIMDNNGNRNWPGPWLSPYSATPIAYQLYDLQGSTELARLARIIVMDPLLKNSYSSQAIAVYTFVRDQILNKHLFTRRGLHWFQDEVVHTSRNMNDKAALMIRILRDVYLASASLGSVDNSTYNYPDILVELATGFKGRFQPYQGGLIWDKGLGDYGPIPPNDVTTYIDTSHANRYTFALVDLYDAGIVFTKDDVAGVSALLTNVIWSQSLTDPRFTNFIDGTNYPALNKTEWGLGQIYSGWVVLAAYNTQVRIVAGATLKAILAGTSNPSLDYMNNMHGRMALSGHLAKAVAP
jgi:hypothetical protein